MLRTLHDLDVRGKRVLLRADYNVPLEAGRVANDWRIRASLPTLRYLLERDAQLIVLSHLGRPKGRPVAELRLDPVADQLRELLGRPVRKLDETVGPSVEEALTAMAPGEIVMLENVRFHPGEQANDAEFADALARLGECYVNDAFGTAHRAHASTHALPQRLPAAAGLLLQREVEMLSRLLEDPDRPFWAMIGGAKLSDKLPVLHNCLGRVDGYLVGGGMAFTLLKAQGYEVGRSLVDDERIPEIQTFLGEAQRRCIEVILPPDVVTAARLAANVSTQVVDCGSIPHDQVGLDIGPETIQTFREKIRSSRTLVWAGPLGAFETPPFHEGTVRIAQAVADAPDTHCVIGGGDTASALAMAGVRESENLRVSTGGGAALRLLGGQTLPALEVLQRSALP